MERHITNYRNIWWYYQEEKRAEKIHVMPFRKAYAAAQAAGFLDAMTLPVRHMETRAELDLLLAERMEDDYEKVALIGHAMALYRVLWDHDGQDKCVGEWCKIQPRPMSFWLGPDAHKRNK